MVGGHAGLHAALAVDAAVLVHDHAVVGLVGVLFGEVGSLGLVEGGDRREQGAACKDAGDGQPHLEKVATLLHRHVLEPFVV